MNSVTEVVASVHCIVKKRDINCIHMHIFVVFFFFQALHRSGSHAAYCRAPPLLEQHLVGNVLRATGLGGGHYHPPHGETVTLGGNTTLGRGEVELFISAAASPDTSKERGKHTTGWHTDFQENFTIQLSGIKRWTLRRGRIRHPLRATTPVSRDLCCMYCITLLIATCYNLFSCSYSSSIMEEMLV